MAGVGEAAMQSDNDNHQPMFNLPRVILAFILLSVGIFIGRTWYLGGDGAATFLLTFSFMPMRYHYLASGLGFPGGWPAGLWSPLTYVFLSPSPSSLVFDLLWLAAFGTAVAHRFGPWRFILFSAAAAVIGAGLFWLLSKDTPSVLLGPNFVVAALLGAAIRFIYAAGIGGIMTMGSEAWRQPALGSSRCGRTFGCCNCSALSSQPTRCLPCFMPPPVSMAGAVAQRARLHCRHPAVFVV